MTRVRLAVALLGALACSDSSGPNLFSSLSFTFTGGGGGTFSASGNAPNLIGSPPTATSWAAAYVEDGETFVGASSPRSGALVDLSVLRITRTTAGSEPITAACDIDGSESCNGLILYLNFNGNGDSGDFFCGLTTGTIVVTEMGGGRAKGTFSGTGTCIAGDDEGEVTDFSVSNGAFDVALVAAPG